ncbi:MAG: hypothetical protein IPH78_13985 [Bacteroidetes bacterium]|nr:hypothetical protein [Bacteroidota bacterium]
MTTPGGGWIVTGITYTTANSIRDVIAMKIGDNEAHHSGENLTGANEEKPRWGWRSEVIPFLHRWQMANLAL